MFAIVKGFFDLIKTPFVFLWMTLAFLFSGSCFAKPPSQAWLDNFHLQLDGATVEEAWDNHGGFHGDGERYMVLSLTDSIEEQLTAKNNEYIGEGKGGPWYAINEYPTAYASLLENMKDFREGGSGMQISIEIENGYFAVMNNFDGKDEFVFLSEDEPLGSFWNCEFVLYDADEMKLYYYEIDI